MPKILFLGANARNTTRLQVGVEVRDVTDAIRFAGARDRFPVEALFAVRPEDLQQSLLEHKPDVLHFSGHGTSSLPRERSSPRPGTRDLLADDPELPAGGILLEDTNGAAVTVRPEALTNLLAILRRRTPIRCVVLNACFSAEQARGIAEHIDVVIGMKRAIDDKAAIAFAIGFYRALADGDSLQGAFDLGRNEIALRGLPDADVPELIALRPDLTPDRIFLSDAPVPHLKPPPLRARLRRIAPIAAALLGLSLLAVLALPLTSLRAAAPRSGAIVVAGPWLTHAEGREARRTLCAALDDDTVREEQDPRVDCISLARLNLGDERLRQQAITAGASLLVIVSGDGHARLLPLGQLAANPLFAERLPRVDLTRHEAPRQLAPLLRSIASIADAIEDARPTHRPCPAVDKDASSSIQALALFVQQALDNCEPLEEQAWTPFQECSSNPSSDVCTFVAEIAPVALTSREKAPDAAPFSPGIDDARRLANLEFQRGSSACREEIEHAPSAPHDTTIAEVEQLTHSLAEDAEPCIRITASILASCLLTVSPEPGFAEPTFISDTEKLADQGEACPSALRARVLGERAWWRARRASWSDAEADYAKASRLSPNAVYALNRVEVLLRKHDRVTAKMVLKNLRAQRGLSAREEVHRALLTWTAQLEANDAAAATPLKLAESQVNDAYHERLHARERAFDDAHDPVLRPLVCRPGPDDCALDVLADEKTSDSERVLAKALAAVSQAARREAHEAPHAGAEAR